VPLAHPAKKDDPMVAQPNPSTVGRNGFSVLESPSLVEAGATLAFDVCIAGAGAAGITLALELEASGRRVCLLEAGGLEPPPLDSDHPYAGESVGQPYDLLLTRLRYFGGTTNHWGGWCRPLDEIDFQKRPGVPLSGWPIKRSDLDLYYRRAARICEIEPDFDYDRLPVSGPQSRE
jgi:choline dehydrogenase-like flavoprotein